MSEDASNPEQLGFIQSYNGRRRWARVSKLALVAAFVAAFIGRMLDRSDDRLWILIAVLFLLHIYLNWIRAKCPQCGRFIGFSDWARRGLSRGLPCESEITCAQALDKP